MRDHFLTALSQAGIDSAQRSRFAERESLDAELDRARKSVQERYPELPLDNEHLALSLATRVETAEDLDALHAADVHLAASCARGEPAAIARFQREFGPDLDRAIARRSSLGLSTSEFQQRVFEHLLVSNGARPARIASYRGRGPLQGFVRVTVSRLVVDLSRQREGATKTNDELAKRLGTTEDGELAYLRHAYGAALAPAFEQALSQLTVRQRNLLRQRFLHELSVERLATVYGVHRSTLFGWLGKARLALLEGVGRALAEHIPGQDLDSVVALLGSHLHLSVHRMLDSRLEDDSAA